MRVGLGPGLRPLPDVTSRFPMRVVQRHIVWVLAMVILLLTFSSPSSVRPPSSLPIASLPVYTLSFEPAPAEDVTGTRFIAHTPGRGTFLFAPHDVRFTYGGGQALHMSFAGAAPDTGLTAGSTLPGTVNYLQGSDPARWRMGLSSYSAITYNALYPGVSLSYAGADGQLKGTYAVAPHADPSIIRWRYEGAPSLSVDDKGNLQVSSKLSTQNSKLTEHAPLAWQVIDGKRMDVPVRYAIMADSSVGFSVGRYDPSHLLVIDPTLTYGSYLGGSSDDTARSVAVDAEGNIYVAGQTTSSDFPTVSPYQPATGGDFDAFVSKFDPTGQTLLYSTYIGGAGEERARGIGVDAQGRIYVAGSTNSTNFPLAAPLQATYGGGDADGFVLELNAQGSALIFSTYLGGQTEDRVNSLALDGAGNAVIAGATWSADFPTHNPYQPYCGTATYADAFAAKLTQAGTLVYSTYLCGGDDDRAIAVTADADGNAYIAGHTNSAEFPTRHAYQPVFRGYQDAFVAKLDTAGSDLVFSTFFGGTRDEAAWAIALDAQRNVYFSGFTRSPDFPLLNGPQQTPGGDDDGYLSKLDASGASLVYSTFLGGSGHDFGQGIAVDGAGTAYVVGRTNSLDFPVANALQPFLSGGSDAFLARLSSSGTAFLFSTFLGGSHLDDGWGLALDRQGNPVVVGATSSTDFPVRDAYQAASAGGNDAFIAKVEDAPSPGPTVCRAAFSDVQPTDYFYSAVTYLYCAGVVSGYSDGTFRPYNNTTRAQLTKIVVLAEGWSLNTQGGPHFTDVLPSDPFYSYVGSAYNRGVISGYSDGSFRPVADVTRAQLTRIVVLAEGWPLDTTGGPHFTDVLPPHAFYAYIETAYNRGVVSGYAGGTFRPGNSSTRGQIAKVVYNAITLP